MSGEDERRSAEEVPGDGVDPSGGDTGGLHRVGRADELAPGDRLVAEVRGREVAVFNVDGGFHAVVNHCTHQGGPVCEGLLSGTLGVGDDGALRYERTDRVLSCPWHGWEFDVTTGEHLAPTGFRLPTYDVVVEDGDLLVRA